MQIGPYSLANRVLLAPMAGVSDRPFRQICREHGAALTVSEMIASNARVWRTAKTRRRFDHRGEAEPRAVQIVGADPRQMAEAARFSADQGAQIIDINMGCPAKKVCRVAAGSALLRDEALVGRILEAVVGATDLPVTLKIRTGWDPAHRNGTRIARIAEQSGIKALAVHGRTRACGFSGPVEYETIRSIKAATTVPVVANGDLTTPEQARAVLKFTGADAVMIGRGAQGRPWIFREIAHYLETGQRLPEPRPQEVRALVLGHLEAIYGLYGESAGVRVARKHIGWYTKRLPGGPDFCQRLYRAESAQQQCTLTAEYFDRLGKGEELAA
jgi:tRNA-dihydrouridine synthase B